LAATFAREGAGGVIAVPRRSVTRFGVPNEVDGGYFNHGVKLQAKNHRLGRCSLVKYGSEYRYEFF
jgi:hypothetical protein